MFGSVSAPVLISALSILFMHVHCKTTLFILFYTNLIEQQNLKSTQIKHKKMIYYIPAPLMD